MQFRLGQYYQDSAQDTARARKCYQRALALDVTQAAAGKALCALLASASGVQVAQSLCTELTSRAPQATWAWKRLAFYQLAEKQFEAAVATFQTALRNEVGSAEVWEGLGFAYQSLGRLTAALKVHCKGFSSFCVYCYRPLYGTYAVVYVSQHMQHGICACTAVCLFSLLHSNVASTCRRISVQHGADGYCG